MANESAETERELALKLADRLLDVPYADPDDDTRTLARQFIRETERRASETAALQADLDADQRDWNQVAQELGCPENTREDILKAVRALQAKLTAADKLIVALLNHRKSGSKASANNVHKLVDEYEARRVLAERE